MLGSPSSFHGDLLHDVRQVLCSVPQLSSKRQPAALLEELSVKHSKLCVCLVIQDCLHPLLIIAS